MLLQLQVLLQLQLLPAPVLVLQGVASTCQQEELQEQLVVVVGPGPVLCPQVLLLLAMADTRPCLLWLQSSCSSKPRS